MLAGIQEAKVGNIIGLGELLRLRQLRDAVITGIDDGSVEVLVPARAQVIQNADDEDARSLPAESLQILSISFLEQTHRLVLNNSDHFVLTIVAQKEAKRSSRKQDVGQRFIVLQGVPELLEVDVLHSKTSHDLRKGDVEILSQVVLERCKECQ